MKPKPRTKVFVAVAEGVMVKTVSDVLVSVRQALEGSDLSNLQMQCHTADLAGF